MAQLNPLIGIRPRGHPKSKDPDAPFLIQLFGEDGTIMTTCEVHKDGSATITEGAMRAVHHGGDQNDINSLGYKERIWSAVNYTREGQE